MHAVNGEDLVNFATEKKSVWSKLIGQQVTHADRGSGKIVAVQQRVGYIPLIDICFANGVATFNSESLRNGKILVFLDSSMALLVSEWVIKTEQKERERLELETQKERERLEREKLHNEKMKALKKIREDAEAIFIPLAEKFNAPMKLLWEGNNITPPRFNFRKT